MEKTNKDNNFSVNMTAKDIFNAKSASLSIKDEIASKPFTVTGCALVKNGGINRDGEPCDIGYIAGEFGVFGFSSNVCIKALPDFADYLSDCLNDGIEVKVHFRTGSSKNGTFYTIAID